MTGFALASALAAALPAAVSASASVKADLLMIFYDAGETHALTPVLAALKRDKIRHEVLVMGTAREVIGKDVPVLDLNKDCGVAPAVDRTGWERGRTLPEEEVSRAARCASPRVVVTGMVSAVQRQLGEAFRRKGARVLGYYDALSAAAMTPIARAFLPRLDRLLVVSEPIAERLRGLAPRLRVEAVGQPTFEAWALAARAVDRAAVAKALGLDPSRRTILYAGGYGEDYAESFGVFADAAKGLAGHNVLVSLHPKVDGALERGLLARRGAANVRVIPKAVSTMEAAVVADLVLCHRSTVGMQALFLGRPVVYVDARGEGFKNPAIELGWSRQVGTSSALLEAIASAEDAPVAAADVYALAGIPRGSADRIASLLESLLAEGPAP